MIQITLVEELNKIEICFPYNPELVNLVRSIPGREWNPERKSWLAPVTSAGTILKTFEKFNPGIDDNILKSGCLRRDIDALTVSELNSKIKFTILTAFPDPVWVVGEIMDYNKSTSNSRHRFLKLVEKDPTGQRITAEVRATLWENYLIVIEQKLRDYAKPFQLCDGIEVRFLAEVSFREKGGTLSLKILDIDPVYTIGKLAENREKILAELQALGLLTKNSSLPLLPFANRIGVISSLTSDGYNDFISEIMSSRMDFHITPYNVLVQGRHVTKTILEALEYFRGKRESFDYIVIIRGGGSTTDLVDFDSKELGVAVAGFPLKVICGIGHERDKTVLDHLSLSLKTPTKVASFLIEQLKQDFLNIRNSFERIATLTNMNLRHHGELMLSLGPRLLSASKNVTGNEKTTLKAATKLLESLPGFIMSSRRANLERIVSDFHHKSRLTLQTTKDLLSHLKSTLNSYSPLEIMKKGYSYVTTPGGVRIKSVCQIFDSPQLNVHFHDGEVRVQVKKHGENK